MYKPGTLEVAPQIEILDPASGQRKVVLSEPRLGPALAWAGEHLAYVLGELPPNQNDSNVWWMKIDVRPGSRTARPRD